MTQETYERLYNEMIESSRKFMTAWQQQVAGSAQGTSAANKPVELQLGFFKEAQSLFERLMWYPPFSMIEGTMTPQVNQYKAYLELVGLYMQLYQEWMGVYIDFSRVLSTTIANTNTKLLEIAPTTQPAELYARWIQEMGDGIDTLLRDQAFAAKLGSVLSRMLDVRKKSDEFMENFYSMMNLPTRTEMRRVYKELHSMKKKIRELSSPSHGERTEKQKRGADEEA